MAEKLPKPQNVPEAIAKYLISELKLNAAWAWNQKCVMHPSKEPGTFDIRLYNEGQTELKKLKVKDYTSLDGHPDLVTYEGTYSPKSGHVQLAAQQAAAK